MKVTVLLLAYSGQVSEAESVHVIVAEPSGLLVTEYEPEPETVQPLPLPDMDSAPPVPLPGVNVVLEEPPGKTASIVNGF